MMMVGHTHEDIDALFRRAAEYWRKRGKVLTPSRFMSYLRDAIPGARIHEMLKYVRNYANFL